MKRQLALQGRLRVAWAVACALCAWPAAAGVTVLIDGAAFPAELRENVELLNKLHLAASNHARHFEGELTGIDKSWVRASNIRGHWHGVVSLDGRPFIIDSRALHDGGGDLVLEAQAPDTAAGTASCATEPASLASTTTLAATLAAAPTAATAQANLATVCQTTVDGVCLLAELDVVFDLLFQQHYGSGAQSQAVALINIVDGYYQNDMNIRFDVLSMTFPATDLFDTTTDANTLLSDISAKKNGGQLPFVTNPRAILHVVTGRDFTGSTVGIANVGSLCSPSNNTGTTQIVSNSTSVTGLVIAHEIGHNFGAGHDGDPGNTCPNGFIMAATLSPNATQFSSCSVAEMTAKINGLSSLAACFEFPVDAALTARAGNPTTAAANQNFTLDYDLSERHASLATTQLSVAGSLSGVPGTFVGASINGIACNVATGGQSYTCSVGSGGGLLSVVARVNGGGALTVTSTATASTTGGTKDLNASNDSVAQTVTASTPPSAPSGLTATATPARIDLAWQDNSGNEDGFRIERRVGAGAWTLIATTAANVVSYSDSTSLTNGVTYEYHVAAFGPGGTSAPSASASAQLTAAPATGGGGGGGGGGALGIELAPLLMLLGAVRRRRGR